MLNEMCVKAPAKLNLHLEVLDKMPNGFHTLQSIFQTVPLYDELKISVAALKGDCKVICKGQVLPMENTIVKSFRDFCCATGLQCGIEVDLIKKIPSGAGLGGGSSDAASLLLALNEMFESHLSRKKLEQIALSVGSDVPFFLSGGCAVVSGRGEIIRNIPKRNDISFVLIYPDVHSSTSVAFELLDEYYSFNTEVRGIDLCNLEAMYNDKVENWRFFNSFTKPLMNKYPQIGNAVESLEGENAEFVEMTGSGSVVFAVFSDSESAKKAYTKLCDEWKWCFLLSSE